MLAGRDALEGLSYAALLCLLPGWLILFLASRAAVTNPQAFVVLAGTAVRLMFVLVGVVAVQSFRPHLQFREFLVWIIAFYLATLLIETLMLVRPSAESSQT